MTIHLTLAEIQDRCTSVNWLYYCEQEGMNEWAVNEGGGGVEVVLTEEQGYKYGIIS